MNVLAGRRIFYNLKQVVLPSSSSRPYSTAGREARFLKKLMVGTSKSKKKWFTEDQSPSSALKEFNFMRGSGPLPAERRQKSGRVTRRVTVLNTVFMNQISSLLATGEAGVDVFGLGLEISRIQMNSDFSALNVYWYTSGMEKDEHLEELLNKSSFIVRHQLSQLRVIGYVPPIKFVRDTAHGKLLEFQRILAEADYGEDFEPTDLAVQLRRMKIQSVPASTISFELREKIEEFECGIRNAEESEEDLALKEIISSDFSMDSDFAPNAMRHDILGLRHNVMMNKVMEGQRRLNFKRKQIAGEIPSDDQQIIPAEKTQDETLLDYQKEKLRTNEFLVFLKNRRIEKEKELKRLTNEWNKAAELFEKNEFGPMSQEEMELMSRDDGDEDYIDEEEDSDGYRPS